MSKYKNINKNKNTIKYIILIVVISFISSCSSSLGDKFQKLEHPKEDEAIIYFYRPKKFECSAINYQIYEKENNIILGKLHNGEYYFYRIPKGEKVFIAQTGLNTKEFNLNIENGKTYFIRGSSGIGIITCRPILKVITNQEEALKELKQCRIVKKKEDIKPKEKEINSERINEICGDRCKIKNWETDTITKVNPIIKFGE